MITYKETKEKFINMFADLGFDNKRLLVAEADSGAIGGRLSHEYHLAAEGGEDIVISCKNCGYCANIERSESRIPLNLLLGSGYDASIDTKPIEKSRSKRTKEESRVCELVERYILGNIKNIDFVHAKIQKRNVMLCTLKGRSLNPLHFALHELLKDVVLPVDVEESAEIIKHVYNSTELIFIDTMIRNSAIIISDYVKSALLTRTLDSDHCIKCESKLTAQSTIELGHSFHLSSKYSTPLEAYRLSITFSHHL